MFLGTLAHRRQQMTIAMHPGQPARQFIGGLSWSDDTVEVLTNKLHGRAACVGADDWKSGGAGFCDYQRPRIHSARQDKHAVIPPDCRLVGRLNESGVGNASFINKKRAQRARPATCKRPRISNGSAVKPIGFHQGIDSFDVFVPADEEKFLGPTFGAPVSLGQAIRKVINVNAVESLYNRYRSACQPLTELPAALSWHKES
jgi:hypothetical protein